LLEEQKRLVKKFNLIEEETTVEVTEESQEEEDDEEQELKFEKEQRKINAILRYHYKVDPEELDDETQIRLWHEYIYVKSEERIFQMGILRTVLGEIVGTKNN
jgi:hypothetical protein